MTILDKIVENKKKELELITLITPVKDLERSVFFDRETISLSASVSDKSRSGIIAEFKRKSPSKGIINSTASVSQVTTGYFMSGASGVSVLTDARFFGGSSADLKGIRENSHFPILRKDFIIDEYQVIESKSFGADAILLIAAVLNSGEILNLAKMARSLGLEVLLEVHDLKELNKVNEYVNIVGANNRDLKTFKVNMDISMQIIQEIQSDFVKISESGISDPDMLTTLRNAGYDGFLMGEKFMSTPDPAGAFSDFLKEI